MSNKATDTADTDTIFDGIATITRENGSYTIDFVLPPTEDDPNEVTDIDFSNFLWIAKRKAWAMGRRARVIREIRINGPQVVAVLNV